MIEDGRVRLRDGRRLGYATYGEEEGRPVLLFHGTPGSRLWFVGDEPVARSLGLRLIATDRPGYGLSDPMPGRRFVDWPADVADFTARLGIDRFGLLSISGGGPFALACAAVLGPERVSKAVVVAAPSPIDAGGREAAGMARSNRVGFLLARVLRHARWLARLLLRPSANFVRQHPDAYFDRMAKELCEADRRISRDADFRAQVHRELAEAYRGGVEGLIDESILLTRPWGFDLGTIEVPVELWHGEDDTLAPVAMAEALHRRIPGSELRRVPERGHFLLDEELYWREVLDSFPGGN